MPNKKATTDSGLYQKTTLKNGLRVVTEQMPSVRSISLGVWVDVGSRNEAPEENGVTHLIEHMFFKGTRNRTAKEIAASLESIGGSLNAFTSKENTCYTARILDENLDTAIDVLADLTCNATLTPGNLAREKKVICEEINESLETPSDHIHDIFASTYWGKHPLGQPIMGDTKTIMNMPRKRVINFIRRHYKAESIVIAATGSVSHARLVKLVKEKFAFADGLGEPCSTAERTLLRNVVIEKNGNNQVHLCLGFPGLDYVDKRKMALLALNSYLGGGMSSVLFQKIREEKGMAYTVYTYLDFYRDSGLVGAYCATDKNNVDQCIDITLKELRKLKKRRLPGDKLEQVKAQLKGHLTLGMESTSSRMSRLARLEMMLNNFQPLKQTLKEIDQVKPDDVLELANTVFDESALALAILGPVKKEQLNGIV